MPGGPSLDAIPLGKIAVSTKQLEILFGRRSSLADGNDVIDLKVLIAATATAASTIALIDQADQFLRYPLALMRRSLVDSFYLEGPASHYLANKAGRSCRFYRSIDPGSETARLLIVRVGAQSQIAFPAAEGTGHLCTATTFTKSNNFVRALSALRTLRVYIILGEKRKGGTIKRCGNKVRAV